MRPRSKLHVISSSERKFCQTMGGAIAAIGADADAAARDLNWSSRRYTLMGAGDCALPAATSSTTMDLVNRRGLFSQVSARHRDASTTMSAYVPRPSCSPRSILQCDRLGGR